MMDFRPTTLDRGETVDDRRLICNGGPCDQGRRACPTPAACRLPDTSLWRRELPEGFAIAALLVGIFSIGALIFLGTLAAWVFGS